MGRYLGGSREIAQKQALPGHFNAGSYSSASLENAVALQKRTAFIAAAH
jgi:hypothetical protein